MGSWRKGLKNVANFSYVQAPHKYRRLEDGSECDLDACRVLSTYA